MNRHFKISMIVEIFLGSVFSLTHSISVVAETLTPSTETTPETVTISAEEWAKMQSDLADIKQQLADDKAKNAEKLEADKLKKYETPQIKLNGVIMWDGAFSSLDQEAETATNSGDVSGTKLRQAWIDLTGSMYDMVNYRLTYDASNSTIKDAWIGFYNLPSEIDVKFGHMKEPWSGEELTTVAAATFIEKSYLNDLRGICGSRNNGILASNWRVADRFSWAAGIFASSMKEDSLNCVGDNGHVAFTGRMTYLPYFEENNLGQKFFLHLGGSYSYRSYDQSKANAYGTKCSFLADSQIVPNGLNTGTLDGLDSLNALCFEVFWMRGPLSIDFEQGFFFMEDDRAGNALLQTGYVQVSYMLTGESRNYRKAGGSYGRLKPNNPFIRTCKDGIGVFSGPGAWEVAYMFTWVDTDELVSGYATETHHTGYYGKSVMNCFALNWYLNQNCKVAFNYALVHSDYSGYNAQGVNIDGTDGMAHVFATRFQVNF